MRIGRYCGTRLIDLNFSAKNKEEAIRKLADLVSASELVTDKVQVYEDLMARERVVSTGIGYGVAFPHCKTSGTRGIVIAFARSKEGIDFQAVDGGLTHLFFTIITPPAGSGTYLAILGYLSRKLKDEKERNKLMTARFPQEIIDFLNTDE
jgi:fructose-specific phosphotransferase system IIA component